MHLRPFAYHRGVTSPDSGPAYPDGAPATVRSKLISAAAALFEETPPTEVTTKQIALAAGVNHGQIHHYFGSKHGLIAATIADDTARYHQERLAEATEFPLGLDADHRPREWRTLAYLAASGAWRQPPFEPSPVVSTLARRRAEDLGRPPEDTQVLSDVAATLALQRGWWVFRDIIETALREFEPDIAAVRREVSARSSRLFDESIRLGTRVDEYPSQPSPVQDGRPRGRNEVSESLMAAAVELLADHPPTKVTTKEIAARAGVNHGQVHHYFASKEHLIAQSIRFGVDPLVQQIDMGTIPSPVPIRTERRLPVWRTLAHIASTEEWVNEAYERAPLVRRSVDTIASRLDEPTTATTVQAQAAVVHALELGWAIYRDIIEYGLDAMGGDIYAIRRRLAAMSCRLVDEAVRVD